MLAFFFKVKKQIYSVNAGTSTALEVFNNYYSLHTKPNSCSEKYVDRNTFVAVLQSDPNSCKGWVNIVCSFAICKKNYALTPNEIVHSFSVASADFHFIEAFFTLYKATPMELALAAFHSPFPTCCVATVAAH